MTIDAEEFRKATGSEPCDDDLDRCNCVLAGEALHSQCGWDSAANLPVFFGATAESRMEIRRTIDANVQPASTQGGVMNDKLAEVKRLIAEMDAADAEMKRLLEAECLPSETAWDALNAAKDRGLTTCIAHCRSLPDEDWQVFPVIRASGLDPIQVFILDEAPGAGRLIVQCYGSAWTAYWGAMGDRTVRQFIGAADSGYIASKLHTYTPGTEEREEGDISYLTRIVDAVKTALQRTLPCPTQT